MYACFGAIRTEGRKHAFHCRRGEENHHVCLLALADDEIGVWLRCGALEATHATMLSHPQSSVVQQNGCHAVQLVTARLGAVSSQRISQVMSCVLDRIVRTSTDD
jgi:hypothetical protein